MNEQKVRQEIQKIVDQVYIKGWHQGKATQKAWKEIERLGLEPYLPAHIRRDTKCGTYLEEIIKAANNAGGKKVKDAGFYAEGDGYSTEMVTEPSALYLALNEVEPTPPANDYEMVTEWLNQPAPAVEELTKDDVLAAYVAKDVVSKYNDLGSKLFDFGHALAYFAVAASNWNDTLKLVQRGTAVLNGYLLVINTRCPIWEDAETHPDAVVSRGFGAGYLAMQEMHRTMSLVPADDLITISEAAEILYGSAEQSKRVMLKEDINGGDLQVFRSSTERNPQKWQRVSRRDVLRLKALRTT